MAGSIGTLASVGGASSERCSHHSNTGPWQPGTSARLASRSDRLTSCIRTAIGRITARLNPLGALGSDLPAAEEDRRMHRVMDGIRVLEVAEYTFVPAAGAVL